MRLLRRKMTVNMHTQHIHISDNKVNFLGYSDKIGESETKLTAWPSANILSYGLSWYTVKKSAKIELTSRILWLFQNSTFS